MLVGKGKFDSSGVEWEAVKKLKTHCAAIICLNWEDSHVISDDHCHTSKCEDRTFHLVEVVDDLGVIHMAGHNEHGLHCLALNTTIFWNRKN
ncbi:hypothetical protein P8452_38374 [Trifolium repens]|nr:hypothetical protein P8452_38374 [Trifolium repens]